MKSDVMLNHTKKINKVIIVITFAGVVISTILRIVGVDETNLLLGLGFKLGVIVAAISVYKKVSCNKTTAIISISLIFLIASSFGDPYFVGYFIFMVYTFITMYLNKTLLLVNNIVYSIMLISVQLTIHPFENRIFIVAFVLINFSAANMYFICKWGRELIFVAYRKEENAKENLDKISNFTKKIANGNIEQSYGSNEDGMTEQFNMITNSINGVINEIDFIIKSVLNGDLSVKGDPEKFKGSYSKIIDSVNKVIEAFLNPIKEASQVLSELSKGNLRINVKGEYKGDLAIIKTSLNSTIKALLSHIDDISDVLSQISLGNFNVEIENEYQGDFVKIKNSINSVIESFNEVLFNISVASHEVALGTRQVSDSSQSLAQASTEQTGFIEQVNQTTINIAKQTKENAANAANANHFVLRTKESAKSGNVKMKELLSAMQEINDSSKSIFGIMDLINDISFQTNILSINAAIEAARAGQYGKGFAVVADEVRNLSIKSSEAAKETSCLVETSLKKIATGVEITNNTEKSLKSIVDEINSITGIIGDIDTASNNQSTGIEHINTAIGEISQTVSNNSAAAQEIAAASEEILSQSEVLSNMVKKFNLKKTSNTRENNDTQKLLQSHTSEHR